MHPFGDYYGSDRDVDPSGTADKNSISNSKNANIARFSFSQLCDDAVGAADFIAISELFDIVFLERVPQLRVENRNQVPTPLLRIAGTIFYSLHFLQIRRFITLIDALYEAKVIVVVQAAAPAHRILDVEQETKKNSLFDEV